MESNPIQVADRLFGAMEYLAQNGPTGLMEITTELKLNKSTAHRVLASLQYMGYVRQNEENGKYELTFRIVNLANELIEKVDIIGVVRPHLKKLMEKTGETVHFVRQEGIDAVYIDKVASTQNSVQMVSKIGSRIPLYCSGVGKTILAEMPDDRVREVWEQSEVVRKTPYTITNFADFMDTLSEIRRKGYGLDNEENESGVRCIAASLHVPGMQGKYAFSISAPVNRMDNDRIQELSEEVMEAKKNILAEFTAI